MLSNSYRYQTINNFEKLLDLESKENILIIITLIFLVLYMHIELTKLSEDGAFNAKFDVDRKLCIGSTGLDWDNSTKIKEVIATDKNDEDKEEDPWEKNRWLKKEKQYLKRVAKAKTRLAKAKTCQ